MDTDEREELPPPLAIAIIGEAVLERVQQLAQRIRQNIDQLLTEQRREHKAGEDFRA
jgi:hypothetical protein